MKLYLDTCSLQRPLDSKTQVRIMLEAEAILGILTLCESGQVELVSSEILMFELAQNPHSIRREYALEVMAKAKTYVALNDSLENRARALNNSGLSPLDALHLAAAEAAEADYLCTCDDKFLKKAKTLPDLKTRVRSPVELIGEIEQ